MKLYKLTNAQGRTRGRMQWGAGVTHTAIGSPDQPLCSSGFIHAYESPLLAILLNPIHANFSDPLLWEAEGDIVKRDGQLKCGCRALTTKRQIPLPMITTEQRVRFAILCAKQVYKKAPFVLWADNWLQGIDRSYTAAANTKKAAYAAATCPWLRQIQILAAAVLFESEHSPMQERAQRKQALNSSQNIERSKAGIQSLPWRNRASRSRRVSTKLHHQVFHRTDEILLRYTSGSIRIERIPNRACALRCEHCRRAERLKCLIELRLID